MLENKSKFNIYLGENLKLLNVWILGILIYTIFRIFLILYFNQKIGDNIAFNDFLMTLFVGFKFDSHAVSMFLIPSFLFNSILFIRNTEKIVKKVRIFFSYLLLTVSLFLFVVTITYITEYNDQFNYFVFEALYDDVGAIANTIFIQYNPILSLLVFIIMLFLSISLLKKVNQKNFTLNYFDDKSVLIKIFIVIVFIIFIVFASRGTINGKPAIKKWAYVTQDEFLNKIVMNPFRTLIYAYKDFKKLQDNDNINPYLSKNDTIENISTKLFNKNSDEVSLKITRGNTISMPNHIVLVVMESYDSWPLQDKFKDLHITDNLNRIKEKGIHFKNFLPASHSTMNSLGTIISGLPYVGVNISMLKSVGKSEHTSIFEQMEQLGYDSYFFYGGFLSWQNIGKFVKNQGANHIYSAAHAGGKTVSGTWGIDDDQLFTMVQKNLKDKKKTFSIIMTTSYHGPFTIDVNNLGYPYKTVQDYPKKYQELDDGSISSNVLGHLWYSDRALGDFVDNFEKEDENTLFAFTGDHYGRRSFNSKANLYEVSSVPFILYSKSLENKKFNTNVSGSHVDIFPTILELISPQNINYNSYGEALQYKKGNELAIGYKKALDINKVYKIQKGKGIYLWNGKNYLFNDTDEINNNELLKDINLKYNNYMSFFWDMTMKID